MRRHLVIGLFTLAACGPAEGEPSDPALGVSAAAEFHSAQVRAAMDAASALVQTRGFAPTGEDWRGFLVQHASDVREMPMRSGTCYVGLAAASAAVGELSLRVFDSDGGEVMSEDVRGPTASLLFCPSQSGTYYLAVSASAGNGLFEVRAFRGPTGLDIRVDDVFREVAPVEPDEKR